MFRYLAWLWPSEDAAAARMASRLRTRLLARSAQWRCALDTDELCICSADERAALTAHPLFGNAGVVLGSLFEQGRDLLEESPMPPACLGESATRVVVASRGEALVYGYWGSYVAFIKGEQTTSIVMAPTGALPCMLVRSEGLWWSFSCIADALALGLPRPRPSPTYLRDRLRGRPIGSDDPLNQVTRLHRGEALALDARLGCIDRRVYWRPKMFVDSADPLEDAGLAARAIRSTLRACTHTLCADHARVGLRLSGGLDSSIIAACLGGAPHSPAIRCHTYFNPMLPADIRPWARLSAEHHGYAHDEYAYDATRMDLPALALLQPSVDVVPCMEYLGRSALERSLADTHGITAIFTGDGGDSGFCSDSVALALVEYLKRHGPTWQALQLATQVSLATHRTVWHVLATSWRRWRRGGRLHDQHSARQAVTQLIPAEVLTTDEPDALYDHPWFEDDGEVAWATIRRVGGLSLPPRCYDLSIEPYAFAPEILQPLYAQPMIELLLRIPLYTHFEAGRDRGLARRAFDQDVPQAILRRLWKDRAAGIHDQLIERHREWLREIYLDGELVRLGLLDRRAVEAALSVAPSRSTVLSMELLGHLDTELWARQWYR
ncbi:MAG TPA: asparagine synthase-related protein [Steroidobacteraceae bacterium]|jgi:asparagine synthase (glutamine-hydrolysing)